MVHVLFLVSVHREIPVGIIIIVLLLLLKHLITQIICQESINYYILQVNAGKKEQNKCTLSLRQHL